MDYHDGLRWNSLKEGIAVLAYFLYQKRVSQDVAGTAEEDWANAEDILCCSLEELSARAFLVYETRIKDGTAGTSEMDWLYAELVTAQHRFDDCMAMMQ